MAWSKLKNIIILILLCFNLFLLLLIAGQQLQAVRYERDTLEQTLSVLEQNGITAGEGLFPPDELPDAVTVSHEPSSGARLARLLLDNSDVIAAQNSTFELYSSVSGNLTVQTSGAFSATLSIPWTEYDSIEAHADALLGSLGLSIWTLTVSGETVTAIPSVNDHPVFDQPTVLTYHGDTLVALSGYLSGKLTADAETEDTITVPTALMALLDYVLERGIVCRSIEEMTPGYTAALSLSGTARLTPCWLVKTDTGSYYLDALSGSITPVA